MQNKGVLTGPSSAEPQTHDLTFNAPDSLFSLPTDFSLGCFPGTQSGPKCPNSLPSRPHTDGSQGWKRSEGKTMRLSWASPGPIGKTRSGRRTSWSFRALIALNFSVMTLSQ